MRGYIGGMFLATALTFGGTPSPGFQAQQVSPAAGELVRFSETCDLWELIEDPEKQIVENGIKYVLRDCGLEEVPVPEMRRAVEKKAIYQSVESLETIPDTSSVVIPMRGGREERQALLDRDALVVQSERWTGDFQFKVTFHSYGAEYYQLGAENVICDDSGPGLYGMEEQLLELIGADKESYQIDFCEWAGESYEDESGTLCRDALAKGRKKVRDCEVLYSGLVDMPEYCRYRYREIYERLPEPEGNTVLPPDNSVPAVLSLRQRIVKIIRTCLTVTVGMAAVLLLAFFMHLLRKMARKLDEERENEEERNKR